MKRLTLAQSLRKFILKELEPLQGKQVAIYLSGGIDSTSLLIALLEVGAIVRGYTFALSDRVSKDMSVARATCKRLKVPCKQVYLPMDLGRLKKDIKRLARFGLHNKTGIECGWPMMHTIRKTTESIIVTGSCADGHFGISKKAMIHYRDSVEHLDLYRANLFSNPNYAQIDSLRELAGKKKIIVPYLSKHMQALFLGTSWEQINKPKEKQTIRDAFPELKELGHVWKGCHTNLQLGDSGIAKHFEKLLEDPDWNSQGSKSVVGIYNRVKRGEL